MESTNWLKQTRDKPLFPDVLWSRPENKRYAGKLLIVGGNSHSFAAVGTAFAAAEKAGIGTIRVVLPDSLEKVLRKSFPEAEFAVSTPSGSFARTALGTVLDASEWADGVLLAGDFGKNSETAILLESFVEKYSGPLTLTGDAVDYFLTHPGSLHNRKNTLAVVSLGQLQKLAAPTITIKQTADLANVVEQLSDWASKISLELVTGHSNQLIAACKGKVSTTAADKTVGADLAAYASVWRLQQPEQVFEALTSAAYDFLNV